MLLIRDLIRDLLALHHLVEFVAHDGHHFVVVLLHKLRRELVDRTLQ